MNNNFNNNSSAMNYTATTQTAAERCSSFPAVSWGEMNTSSPEKCTEYSGTVCKDFLAQWYLCAVGEGNIHIDVTEQSQIEQENVLSQLNRVLGICILMCKL